MLAGVSSVAYGAVLPYATLPLWVAGVPSEQQRFDGDTPTNIDLRLINPHLSEAMVEVFAPGCTANGETKQTVRVGPLSSISLKYPFDPSRLRVGPGEQSIVLTGSIGPEPFQLKRKFQFNIVREIHL